MKIIFNLLRVGLGNNGGSRTLIKSAETLAGLGQEVVLFSDIKSRYTWEKIDRRVKIIHRRNIPKGDVIVATGIGSVISTVRSKFKRKYYFVRGFETWRSPPEKLFNSYRSLNCIVNSGWLKKMLNDKGVKCRLVYNGLDFNDFFDIGNDRPNDIGCLYQKKKTKRFDISESVANQCSVNLSILNKTIKDPTPKKLNKWYNGIRVWLSTSELEGLHNPPMEASLAGCGLVSNDCISSGTSDYAIHNKTALVYKSGDTDDASNCIKMLLRDDNMREDLNSNMVDVLKSKIGTREKNMIEFLDIISDKNKW